MKSLVRNLALLAAVTFFASACQGMKLGDLAGAGKKGLAAAMLTDEQMADMASQGIKDMDSKHTIAPAGSKYGKRLVGLTEAFKEARGQTLDFKVYVKDQVNAFAMPDGSVRIYSGLMDYMTDDELLFVIGHEIGHIRMGHSRKRFQLAYAGSAISEVVKAQDGKVGELAASKVGGFLGTVVSAQFSQANEREADDYGLKIVRRRKADLNAAVSALEKLAKLSKTKPGMLEQMTSSHPEPGKRAERLRQAIAAAK
jgi:putative metalloprotease